MVNGPLMRLCFHFAQPTEVDFREAPGRALAGQGDGKEPFALEVTHGDNGWHPYLHVVFFLRSDAAADEFGVWLLDRWATVVHRLGLGECNPDIWRFERAAAMDAVTD
jgi:hypothetical protein